MAPAVVRACDVRGWGFVGEAPEKPGVLEELAGLAELYRQVQLMVDECVFEEQEEGGVEEAGADGGRPGPQEVEEAAMTMGLSCDNLFGDVLIM